MKKEPLYAQPGQCHARWWDGKKIHVCREKGRSLSGVGMRKMRCEFHAPEGGKLDKAGWPMIGGRSLDYLH